METTVQEMCGLEGKPRPLKREFEELHAVEPFLPRKPAVEAELREIQRYYEERSPGLGAQFVDEFERQILALAATPERWMVVTADIGRCLMRRFLTSSTFDKSELKASESRW